MAFLALIPLGLLALIIYALVRTIYLEFRSIADASEPVRCLRCRHEVTFDMLQRGRCPECGFGYIVSGIETPRMKVILRQKDLGVYGMVCLASAIGAVVVGTVIASSARYDDSDLGFWAGVATFVLLSLSGCVALLLLRRHVRAKLIESEKKADEVLAQAEAETRRQRSDPAAGER